MNIIFFTHPEFFAPRSISNFTQLLAKGMMERGHSVTLLSPKSRLSRLPFPKQLQKWLGYIDQYIIFSIETYYSINQYPSDSLFILVDNALGPWLPLVSDRPNVMHCHDFLAQRSALGEIVENPTSWTGRLYQYFIRQGYSKGKHFISVSKKTQHDLHYLLNRVPVTSEVVYTAMSRRFGSQNAVLAREDISALVNRDLSKGYLLHVGGNVWYKNRIGVLELYNFICKEYEYKLPLLLIGSKPSDSLLESQRLSTYKDNLIFVSDVTDKHVNSAYVGASLFLFPSLNEGFGWPIAEAMASGCPVVTTDEDPMKEVAGSAAFLIPRMPPVGSEGFSNWLIKSSFIIHKALSLNEAEREEVVNKGLKNVTRFDSTTYLDKIEKIYKQIVHSK